MNEQLALCEVAPRTRCGYCNQPLQLQPAGDWACDHCRPELARIRTAAQWVAFHRRRGR